MVNGRLSPTTMNNKVKFNSDIPIDTFVLTAGPHRHSTGVTIEDLEKKIEAMPDYITGQNFDFKFREIEPDFHEVNNLTQYVDQKKPFVSPLPALAVTKARTNAKFLKSLTKKTTSKENRRQKLQEYKTFEDLWNTYQSKLYKIRTTKRSDKLIKSGKPTSQYTTNRLLSSPHPTLRGTHLTSGTFLQLDDPLQISTYIPEVMNDTNLKGHLYNSFHDYFNDLLVWYNDTLNKNVENIWDPVKGLRENIGIIPEKLAGITKEVDLMNQYLSSFEVLRTGGLCFVFNRRLK